MANKKNSGIVDVDDSKEKKAFNAMVRDSFNKVFTQSRRATDGDYGEIMEICYKKDKNAWQTISDLDRDARKIFHELIAEIEAIERSGTFCKVRSQLESAFNDYLNRYREALGKWQKSLPSNKNGPLK